MKRSLLKHFAEFAVMCGFLCGILSLVRAIEIFPELPSRNDPPEVAWLWLLMWIIVVCLFLFGGWGAWYLWRHRQPPGKKVSDD